MTKILEKVIASAKQVARLVGIATLLNLIRLALKSWRLRQLCARKNPHLASYLHSFGPLGYIPAVVKNLDDLLAHKKQMFDEVGDTFVRPAPFYSPQVVFSTRDPRNVEYMLKTNFNNFIKGESTRVFLGYPMLGDGIFVLDHGPHATDKGKQWLFQRKTASKLFTRGAFKGYMFETFSRNSEILVDHLAKTNGERAIDLEEMFFEFTMDSIGSFGFGVELGTLNSASKPPFMTSFDDAQRILISRVLRPGFRYSFARHLYSKERELFQHVDVLNEFSYKVIDERLAESDVTEKRDILSNFVTALRASGELDENTSGEALQNVRKVLRDVVMSFFIAGRDTTASSLSFAFLMLCNHPDAQEELNEEIIRELGGLNSKDPSKVARPTVDQLSSSFPFLNGVVQETLRLFPPVPTDGKTSCEDCVLPDGTFVPKNSRLSFEPYVMGRNKSFWGDDADEFKPSRWIGPDAANPTAYEMPTFQPGPRQCLGKDLAIYETKFVLVELVRRFKFKLARAPRSPPYIQGITITVNGKLPVQATPRC